MPEILEDDALCSSLPVLFDICKRNVLFGVFLEIFATVVLKNQCISLHLVEKEFPWSSLSKGFFKINASSSTYLFSFQYVSKTYNVFINIHSDRDWNQELELFF